MEGQHMKRLLSLITAAAAVLTAVPAHADANEGGAVEIRTAAELSAISGDGDYVLMNDIDLSGMNWEPKPYVNGSLDGNGYSIRNLTISGAGGSSVGLFGEGSSIVLHDLNIVDADIDVTAEGDISVGIFGNSSSLIRAYDCSASGSISVRSAGRTEAAGIYNGTDCSFEGDISVYSDVDAIVTGIYEGSGCTFTGSVTAESDTGYVNACGIELNSDTCVFEGTITAISGSGIVNAYGIRGRNSRCDAELTAESESGEALVYGIYGEGNTYEGSITAEGYTASATGVSGNSSSNSASVRAVAHGGTATAHGTAVLSDGEQCENSGDVTAVSDMDANAYGANGGINSGNVRAESGTQAWAYGAQGGMNSGSVTALSQEGNAAVTAVSSGINNGPITAYAPGGAASVSVGPSFLSEDEDIPYNSGDVYAFGGERAGIENGCANSYGSMTAEAAAGYALINEQTGGNGYCGGTLTAEAYGQAVTSEPGSPGGASLYRRIETCGIGCAGSRLGDFAHEEEGACIHFERVAYISGDNGTEVTPPPDTTDDPGEEPDDEKSYMLRIVSGITNEPIPGAVINVNGRRYTTNDYGCAAVRDRTLVVRDLSVMLGESVIYSEDIYYAAERSTNTIYTDMPEIGPEAFQVRGFNDTIYGPSVNIYGYEFFLFELPLNIEANIADRVKLAYDKQSGSFEVLFGNFGEKNFKEFTADCIDAGDMDWKKAFGTVKEAWASRDISKLTASGLGFKKIPAGRVGEVYADFCGFVEFTVDENDDIVVSESGLMIKAAGEITFSAPIPSAPWAYTAGRLSAELKTAVQTAVKQAYMKSPQFDLSGDIDLTCRATVGIGTGIKDVVHIEGGLGGELHLGMDLPFVSSRESFNAAINGLLYAEARLLAFKVPYEYKFDMLRIYPPDEKKQTVELSAAAAPRLIDRSYMDISVLQSAEPDTVKTAVYPYGDVSMADLGGGRTLMVWLDDDADRELADKTALFYSVCENGEWSEPQIIESDGTADFEFAVSASGGKAAVVWQNADRSFGGGLEEGEEAYKEMASAIGLSCAVFDGSVFSAASELELPENCYPHAPEIAFDGSVGTAVWLSRDISELMDGTDDILSAGIPGYGAEGGYTAEAESVRAAAAAADTNGNCFYIADTDGDVNTSEDRVLFCNGSELLRGAKGLYSCGNSMYAADDGHIYEVNTWGADPVSLLPEGAEPSELVLTDSGSGFTALYTVNDGERCVIRAAEQAPELRFTELCETSGTVMSLSAVSGEDGSIEHAVIAAEGADSGNVTARLAAGRDHLPERLEITEAVNDPVSGDVHIELRNDSSSAIEQAEVIILSADGDEISSETVPAYIPARGDGAVSVSPDYPAGFERQTVTVRVSAPVQAEAAEAELELGGPNLLIEEVKETAAEGTVRVTVKNSGHAAAAGVRARISSESGGELCSAELGTLGAGETVRTELSVPEEYRTAGTRLTAEAYSEAFEEEALYDNEAWLTLGVSGTRPVLDGYALELDIGETSCITVSAGAERIHFISSAPETAEVSEQGVIRGVSAGRAEIYAYTESGLSASCSITVSENGYVQPGVRVESVSAYGDSIDMELSFENMKDCVLIAALYDNGRLSGIRAEGLDEDDSYRSVSIDGSGDAVRLFLWGSWESMAPIRPAVSIELPGYGG